MRMRQSARHRSGCTQHLGIIATAQLRQIAAGGIFHSDPYVLPGSVDAVRAQDIRVLQRACARTLLLQSRYDGGILRQFVGKNLHRDETLALAILCKPNDAGAAETQATIQDESCRQFLPALQHHAIVRDKPAMRYAAAAGC